MQLNLLLNEHQLRGVISLPIKSTREIHVESYRRQIKIEKFVETASVGICNNTFILNMSNFHLALQNFLRLEAESLRFR